VDLFAQAAATRQAAAAPLAERLRPRTLDEFVGQQHLVGEGRLLRAALQRGALHSMILWGPPGTGKTTLARLLAAQARARFVTFSAVLSGVKEVRALVAEAEERLAGGGERTILFVDEIHRFNKAQQDAFLPHVERGTVTLIGATTENPSFEVIGALLSRCRVYVLERLGDEDVVALLRRALADAERGLGALGLCADPEALQAVARLADGDARSALNLLEAAAVLAPPVPGPAGGAPGGPGPARRLTTGVVAEAAQRKTLLHDKAGDAHYDLISALHKSVRDSDPDATLYWLARLLEAGEDRRFVARRLVRMALEDVGLADPQALAVAVAARDAFDFLGVPEGDLALAEAAVYLACAEKSNAVYTALDAARADVHAHPAAPVPLHLRNAPTALLRALGHGRGYRYAHDDPEAVVDQAHLPEALGPRRYYQPTPRGQEAAIRARLARWQALREARARHG
jgi:putative ATPase